MNSLSALLYQPLACRVLGLRLGLIAAAPDSLAFDPDLHHQPSWFSGLRTQTE